MKPLQFLRRSLAALALLAAAAAPAGPARAADIIRIGVATAGGGDPITWGGSPGGVVRANNWLEQAFAADGVKVEWLFFKGAGRRSTRRCPTSRSTSPTRATCRRWWAAPTA